MKLRQTAAASYRQYNRVTPVFFFIAVLIGGFLLFGTSSQPSAHAISSLSQGFTSEEDIPIGSIVSLKEKTDDSVTAASSNNVDNLIGVAVNEANFPLTISNGQAAQVHVAVSGIAPVLVSDLAGEIKRGDHITASTISGVGMKAITNTKVIGIAQADAAYDDGAKQTVKDGDSEQSVTLGQVPVQINISYYFAESEQTIIPKAFQNIANSIAGKPVDPVPIIISAAIFVITIVIVSSIVYSMIRSSIISVGRNPLSQSAIFRGLLQLSALVIGILGVAVAAIYLILTRL